MMRRLWHRLRHRWDFIRYEIERDYGELMCVDAVHYWTPEERAAIEDGARAGFLLALSEVVE